MLLPKTVSIRFTVLGLFLLISGATALLIMGIQSRLSEDLAREAALGGYTHLTQQVRTHLEMLDRQSVDLLNLLELSKEVRTPLDNQYDAQHESLPYLIRMMRQYPMLHAIYIGHENGDMFRLMRTDSLAMRQRMGVSKACQWVVVSEVGAGHLRRKMVQQFDEESNLLQNDQSLGREESFAQPWYKLAVLNEGVSRTEPYLLPSLGKAGVTYARSIGGSFKVVALDISLEHLSGYLGKHRFSPHSQTFLFQENGLMIASSKGVSGGSVQQKNIFSQWRGFPEMQEHEAIKEHPVIVVGNRHDRHPFDYMQGGKPAGLSVDLLRSLAEQAGFRLTFVNGYTWEELVDLFRLGKIDLLQGVYPEEIPKGIGLWSEPYGVMPDSDQAIRFLVSHDLPEWKDFLDQAIGSLPEDLRHQLAHPSLQPSVNRSESSQLGEELLALASKQVSMGQLIEFTHQNKKYLGYVIRLESRADNAQILAAAVPVSELMAPYREQIWWAFWVSLAGLVLLVPLVWWGTYLIASPIRKMAQQNDCVRHREFALIQPVHSHIKEVAELSNSMMSMASSIREYQEAQRQLMDSFIQVVASAIDQKSPYTGGHCRRVPELAIELAKVASASEEGSLKSFRFETEEEWREFRIGAWLHDCGKVTTPEYVVDKSTKLETVYNRIHEVRMRFEVLWRDAEIEFWKRREAGEDEETLHRWLKERQQQIADDFAFVAECNVGGEKMEEGSLVRLSQISQQTWVRHLDDRLGLSPLELTRCPKNAPASPVSEKLLADKPEHRIKRHTDGTDKWDSSELFPVPIPLYRLHLGEMHNLSIRRGTLNEEERFIINEHIISTIRMLEALPFPDYLRRIPEYAGTHHETLDGTGYPRRLKAEEISIPARIVAIADVFEALTASDRPYKTGKTLSESVGILVKMAQRQHIDSELLAIFLRSGIYLEYARKHLRSEQIDPIDIEEAIAASQKSLS